MDRTQVRELLDAVATGRMSVSDAEAQLRTSPLQGFADMGYARLDTHRALRTGDPEVVYGAGKTVDQLLGLLQELVSHSSGRAAVATRLTEEMLDRVSAAFPDATVDDTARCAAVGDLPAATGSVV